MVIYIYIYYIYIYIYIYIYNLQLRILYCNRKQMSLRLNNPSTLLTKCEDVGGGGCKVAYTVALRHALLSLWRL